MDGDRNHSPENSSAELGSTELGSIEPDISDVIRVLRAAAGLGEENGQTERQPSRQLPRKTPDKPTAEDDPELPRDRVEFSPEALKRLSERSPSKAAANVRNGQLSADPNEALNALKIFREMSGVSGAETPPSMPDKSEVEVSRNVPQNSPKRTPPKAAEKSESSLPIVDSDEAENALKFFREMSGVTGSEPPGQPPDSPDDSDIQGEQVNDGQARSENVRPQKSEPANAEQPRPYKPFDITDIPGTAIHAVPPSDEPETEDDAHKRAAEKCSLAVCGADCGDCPFGEENDCPGCGGLWEDCDIVRCAAAKGHEHCGLCDKFPCDLLRDAAFDPDSGDNGDRLLRLKALVEAAKSRKKPRLIIAGCCGGIALGTAIGGFSGALLPWIFAMTVVGAGIGLIIAISGKKDKK